MTARCEDWRQLPSSDVEPLLAAEIRSWRDHLTWDVSESWNVIEPARSSGRLPGFVTRDPAGRVSGWTCFFPHRGSVHVVALVADTAIATGSLVDAVLQSPEARSADGVILSVRHAAPLLLPALAARGLETARYRYLSAATSGVGRVSPPHPADSAPDRAGPSPWRPWCAGDIEAAARLCARAYSQSREVRAFAPHGTPDEWREYVTGLVTTTDCGRFLPEASFVIPAAHPDEIEAVVMLAHLSPGTAHVSQLAVDPAARGRGHGRALLDAAMAAASGLGLERATLLVSAANAPASALYTSRGFTEQSTFVVAEQRQPRRSSSAALATGGASTRR